MMTRLAALPLLLALALPTPAPETDGARASDLVALTARLSAIAARDGGIVGVEVVHLESGRSASLRGDERFPMASTYKVAIGLAVLDRVDSGDLDPGKRIEIRKGDLRRGGVEGILKAWKPGLTLPVSELLERMIIESDNTATDVLFRVLGGPPSVAATLARLKVSGIDVSRTELRIAADSYGLEGVPEECDPARFQALTSRVPSATRKAALSRFETDTRDTASPRAMVALLRRLHAGELLSQASTGRLLDLMRRCRTGDARIRGLLPRGTVVLDKTGTGNRISNDVGIVTLPGKAGHLAVAVYIRSSPRDDKGRDETIAQIALAAFQAFAEPAS